MATHLLFSLLLPPRTHAYKYVYKLWNDEVWELTVGKTVIMKRWAWKRRRERKWRVVVDRVLGYAMHTNFILHVAYKLATCPHTSNRIVLYRLFDELRSSSWYVYNIYIRRFLRSTIFHVTSSILGSKTYLPRPRIATRFSSISNS